MAESLTTVLIGVAVVVVLIGGRWLIRQGVRGTSKQPMREVSLRDPVLWLALAALVFLVVSRGSRALDGDVWALWRLGLLGLIVAFFVFRFVNRRRH